MEAGHGTRGEFAFKLGSRELGHLHGDHVAHFGFPKDASARALRGQADRLPPGLPAAGFGARRIETDDDMSDVIALLRLNYDRPPHATDPGGSGMKGIVTGARAASGWP